MCMDFCTLNHQIHKDIYPIPYIEDLLDKLAHANWFSKMYWPRVITSLVLRVGCWESAAGLGNPLD